jgi:hypothetical protein
LLLLTLGVVAPAETLHEARRDGNDVLECATETDAGNLARTGY